MRRTSSVEWNTLANYESRELLARAYTEKHPLAGKKAVQDIADVAAEISSNIIQARQYFEAAADADHVIRPLLLYYGVLGLSRALILFLSRGRREDTLEEGHGLGTHCWGQALSPTGQGIANLEIKISKHGTFRELTEAVENRSLLRLHSSAVNWKVGHDPLPNDLPNITFGDLIIRTPALALTAKRWLTNSFQFVEVGPVEKTQADETVLRVSKGQHRLGRTIEFSDFEQLLPKHGHAIHDDLPDSFSVKDGPTGGGEFCVWDDVSRRGAFAGIGDVFFVSPIKDAQICQITSIFIQAYILGMFSRYFPIHWTRLVRNEKNDTALPTILNALNYIEVRYPQLALDFFEERP